MPDAPSSSDPIFDPMAASQTRPPTISSSSVVHLDEKGTSSVGRSVQASDQKYSASSEKVLAPVDSQSSPLVAAGHDSNSSIDFSVSALNELEESSTVQSSQPLLMSDKDILSAVGYDHSSVVRAAGPHPRRLEAAEMPFMYPSALQSPNVHQAIQSPLPWTQSGMAPNGTGGTPPHQPWFTQEPSQESTGMMGDSSWHQGEQSNEEMVLSDDLEPLHVFAAGESPGEKQQSSASSTMQLNDSNRTLEESKTKPGRIQFDSS